MSFTMFAELQGGLDAAARSTNADLESMVDFERARRQARWNRLRSLAFGQRWELREMPAEDLLLADLGIKNVTLDSIDGSLSRARDFDRRFFPRQDRTRQRWMRIARAYHDGWALPPVTLFQLGEDYYVADGHHRLSVYRAHGQEFVDARIYRIT